MQSPLLDSIKDSLELLPWYPRLFEGMICVFAFLFQGVINPPRYNSYFVLLGGNALVAWLFLGRPRYGLFLVTFVISALLIALRWWRVRLP